ncbi:solute carrier family 13 member 5-like [Plakobranchus ocellatus]|uniref:Solute carrier family 13 member 5-like n=1 Tax=Plakobranchus ocellatus TaxID=259542 RepID=A0AAV4BLM9_9GAST|nr:solute carrier family 13 member 5-like [Plakobranchus ocellatus]
MAIIVTLRTYWRQVLVIIWPLLLCPLVFPFSERSMESKCVFLFLVMALFWIVELLPLPVTALLPMALCPILGIKSSKEACKVFFNELTLILLGGFPVAVALEKTELHRRAALWFLSKVGLQPRRLLFGIMTMTALISMWISNTATTALMVSITKPLLENIYKDELESNKRIESEIREDLNGGTEDTGNRDIETIIIEYPEIKELLPANEEESRFTDADVESPSDTVLTFTIPHRPDTDESYQDQQTSRAVFSRRQTNRKYHIRGEKVELRNWRQIPLQADEINTISPRSSGNHRDSLEKLHRKASSTTPQGPSFQVALRAFTLSIAYSANIGSMATLIGSPPNLVLSQTMYKLSGRALDFGQWMLFGVPTSVITLVLAYVWMSVFLYGLRSTLTCKRLGSPEQVEYAAKMVREEQKKMGAMKFNEKVVSIHFIILVTLWLTRRPGFVPGWTVLFPDNYVTDGVVAVAIAVSLFIFSDVRPAVLCFRSKEDDRPPRAIPSVLTWRLLSHKMPWGVILLLGGAFVLADAIKVSGLSQTIEPHLHVVQQMPPWLVCLTVIAITCFITEITSNTVVAILLLPLLNNMAKLMRIHPLYLMFPATVSTSMAFMLPVATPPNSVIYAYGNVGIPDMVKGGFVLNFVATGVIFLAANTWGWLFFEMGTVPEWARMESNTTTAYNSMTTSSTILGTTHIASLANENFNNYTR